MNSTYVELGDDDYSINEGPKPNTLLLLLGGLLLAGLLAWFVFRKGK